MTIKVISKRTFQMDEKKKLIPLLKKLRSLTKQQSGHISREILRSIDNPGEYIVISEWKKTELFHRAWCKRQRCSCGGCEKGRPKVERNGNSSRIHRDQGCLPYWV